MDKSSRILCFIVFFIVSFGSVSSSCPIDFDYVETFPWDTSSCSQNPVEKGCCQTLLSLFGLGLAKHLKETSMFYYPTTDSASSCLSLFQTKLSSSFSFSPSLVSQCLGNASQFVVNPSSCAGIATIPDWVERVGPTSLLDSSCTGELTGLTRCSLCLDAGMKVNTQLVAMDKNSTKCFYYSVLYAAGVINEFGPEHIGTAACILALPLSRLAMNDSQHFTKEGVYKIVFGSIGALLACFVGIGLIAIYRKREKKKRQNAVHREYVTGFKARVLPNTGVKWFFLADLERATNGFAQRNMIGQGGFGVVYKGILSDGTIVAVKQIHGSEIDSKGDEEFANEVEIISKIRHRNLLSLRGCCVTSDSSRGKTRYFVYDFMPNGNLDNLIFNSTGIKKSPLTWPQRKNIIIDVAKGLAYLHNGIQPAIYHRDIKATNILLDSDMKAKVADFGLAKQTSDGKSHLTTRVAGTYGYLAPEYALYGQLTEKSDVYSFGIVILETMSGRRVLDTTNSSTVLITDWAWDLVKSGNAKGVFDEAIREEGPRGIMERFVLVGVLCAHVMVALRPSIADALKMLEGDIDIPIVPDRPLPLSHESYRSSFLHSSSGTSERSRSSSRLSSI